MSDHPWIRKSFVLTAQTRAGVEMRVQRVASALRRQGGILIEVKRSLLAPLRPSVTLVYELPQRGPFDVARTTGWDALSALGQPSELAVN